MSKADFHKAYEQGTSRWYFTPNQNLACFVLNLKIINTFIDK